MEIDFVYDQSVVALGANVGAFAAALNAAASYLDNLIANSITVNISVGWGEDGGQALSSGDIAEGGPDYGDGMGYAQLTSALRASATSALDRSAYATLPAGDPRGGNTHYYVASAQEKAWGAPASQRPGNRRQHRLLQHDTLGLQSEQSSGGGRIRFGRRRRA
jgi:hypothetical protein